MKICPVCNQTYTDDNLNFCLNDGGTLNAWHDDAPPTVMFKQARTTQQNWETNQPSSPWGSQPPQPNWGNQPLQQNQTFHPAMLHQQNQTLPTAALILGVCSIVLSCCYLGIPLGAGALVLGLLGLKNSNENPTLYGGRGLAIGGIVTGVIGILISVILLIGIAVS